MFKLSESFPNVNEFFFTIDDLQLLIAKGMCEELLNEINSLLKSNVKFKLEVGLKLDACLCKLIDIDCIKTFTTFRDLNLYEIGYLDFNYKVSIIS